MSQIATPAHLGQTPAAGDARGAPIADDDRLEVVLGEIAAGAAERDRERGHPFAAIDVVRRARLGAVRLPVADGGAGYSFPELFRLVVRLAEADPNVAQILRAHYSFVEQRLISPDRAAGARWLGLVADGAILGNATTELGPRNVGFGRAADPATAVRREGDRLLLRGTKYYCTGTLYADWVSVLAAGPDGAPGSVVVPVDREGVTVEDDWDGFGQRLTGTGTTRFDDVVVAEDELLRVDPANGPYLQGAFLQLYLTATIVGIVRNVARDATDLVRSRSRTFTHAPTAEAVTDPLLQRTVGEIASQAYAAEVTVGAAAEALGRAVDSVVGGVGDPDLAHEASLRVAQAKVVIDALGVRVAGELFDVGGASATARGAGLDRHWRNIRTLASHNPASYKALAIGDLLINGTRLPDNGFF
ncbi:MAG: acyl-CoA dehydrogenase family protein [Patulibacter sp.]